MVQPDVSYLPIVQLRILFTNTEKRKLPFPGQANQVNTFDADIPALS